MDDKEKDKMSEMSKQSEVGVQVRCQYSENRIHIQGIGETDNRPYGFACKYSVPKEMSDWLRVQEDNLFPSLASGTSVNIYIRGVYITQYSDGYQISVGGVGGNFDESYVLDLVTDKSHIMAMIDWASNNDLLIDGTDTLRPVIDMAGEEE